MMTKRNSADVAFFLVEGQDVLGTLTEVDIRIEAFVERTDTLGDSWKEDMYLGQKGVTITQRGFYDDAADSVHAMLTSGPGVGRVLAIGVNGTATGAFFYGMAGAIQVNYNRIFNRSEFTKAEAEYRTTGAIEQGRLLRMLAVVNSTGSATGVPIDNSVSSTGGAGYFEFNNASHAAPIVRILHSSDNITYASLMTLQAVGPHNAVRGGTTGTIERYTAVRIDSGAAGATNSSYQVMVGLVRV